MDWDKEPDLQEFHRTFQVHPEEVMWAAQEKLMNALADI